MRNALSEPVMVLHDAPGPAMRSRPSSFSARAAVVGTIACLLVGFGAPYSTLVLKGSSMDYDFSTAAALFLPSSRLSEQCRRPVAPKLGIDTG